MRKDPPMPDEIKQGFYPGFEHGWHVVEVVGRSVLALFVLACFLGLLGDGPLARRQIESEHGTLRVQYEPVVRYATPAHFDVQVAPVPGMDTMQLDLGGNASGIFGLQQISPQPVREAGAAGHPELLIAVPAGQKEMTVRFDGVPDKVGRVGFTISQKGGETLSWTQFVAP